jgi:hypothetical protein
MPQRTIPVIASLPQLAQWQTGIRAGLKIVVAPPVPANFTLVTKQGGNYLQWAATKGADGYLVEVASAGDFSNIFTSHLLKGQQSVAYFDTAPTATGTAPATRYYRVSGTGGTVTKPQSITGRPSAVLSGKAIAPNDTVTGSTSARDNSNYDALNVAAGRGRYRG